MGFLNIQMHICIKQSTQNLCVWLWDTRTLFVKLYLQGKLFLLKIMYGEWQGAGELNHYG